MRKFILLGLVFFTSFTAFGQDFSNKGKDFWVAYGYHERMNAGTPAGGSQDMVLYFATDQVTNISITIPGTGYTQNITTPAGNFVATSAPIPKAGAQDSRLFTEGLSDKGIHITSDKPMVAYSHIYNQNVSGASILYPTNTLGREYYSVNYKNWSNTGNANCWFYVVATDTGSTTIEITPQANLAGAVTIGGWVAGTTYTVNLTQGQVYNVMGILTGAGNPNTGVDLTGSRIKSINNGSGCKKIGVFSGSGRISISCDAQSSSSDNYMVQAMPKNAWGKKYLTVPANGNQANNIFRVCVSNPAAIVRINGAITGLPLINNFYYEIPITNQPQLIEADSAIMVAQYFTSQSECGNGNIGDPEVIYLSAVEQNINRVLWNASQPFNIITHHFNVVLPNTGTALSSFMLDGINVPAASFVVHPQEPNYSYLKLQLAGQGAHLIQSDSGFNAIAYGFGSAESYGYNAGTNIKDLYQQIGVTTQYGIETTPSVCTNSPFKFKVSLPYCPDSITWNLSSLPGPPPSVTMYYSTCTPGVGGPDSVTIVNGRTINWYSLPSFYSFSTVGVYPVTIITYAPNGECGTLQEIDFDLTVSDPPAANFSWIPGGCFAEPFRFAETTSQFPKPTYAFYWNFGDPGSGGNNTSNVRNPVHIFSAPGTYTVRHASITTPGCLSDTIEHQVFVPELPTGTISGTATVCINTMPEPIITFTGTLGTPPYTFTYTINGGAPLNVNSPGSSSTATVLAPTTTAGVFIYELINVRDTGSTLCSQTVTGQKDTVTIIADATVTLTSAAGTDNQTVCINNPIINITYAIAGSGTGGSVSGLPTGVTGTFAGGIITITGTPTVSGVFNYSVSTTGPCVTPTATGSITVTADATIALTSAAGTDNQTLCINTLLTNITYAVGGTGTGGSVSGLPAGVTGTYAAGVITISGIPSVSGVFNYTVTTTGPCVIPTATGTITVTADATLTLTSAAGTDNQTVCINTALIDITYAVGGTGTGGSVSGLPAGVTGTYAAGVITIMGTPSVSGVFNYTVTTTGPCVIPSATGTITVTADATITLTSAAGTDNQTLCINTLLTNITYAVGGTGTGGSVSGLPAGVTGTYAAGVITIMGTPSVSGVFNYTVTTTGPCVIPSATGTITVTADATITLTSAAGTDNQTLCINVPITNITYAVGGSGTGGSVSGLPTGVTGTYAAGVITITGTPTVIGTFNYTVSTTGPCVIPTTTGTIIVNPDATLTLTSAPPTTSQELCNSSVLINITYAVAGGGSGATVTGLPAGVNGVYAAGVFTISGSPTANGVFNYTVTTTGICVQQSATGTITVNALPTPNFTFTAPSCETRTINFTDLSVANSGVVNSWSWNFDDPASGGANTSNLQNPSHTFATAGIYNVTLSVTTDKGCVSNPIANIPVTINARPQAGFIIPEVCLSDTYAQFLDTSKVAVGTITAWAWNFGDPGSGPLNTSTLQNPTHSYSAVGPYNVELIVTSNTGCKDTIVQLLTVNGSFPVANFSVQNPATLCANDSVAVVEASTVFPGVITKIEIWFDDVNAGPPGPPDILDNSPFTGKVYKHLYPNFQAPLTKIFTIRYRAYSGGVCLDDSLRNITVNAAPLVQFNAMPDTCLLVAPFQITQASEIGGVPGTGVFSGPGVSPGGIFTPSVAGIGTHTILYTFTSAAGGCVDTMSNTITVLDTATAKFTYIAPICQSVPGSFTDISTAPATVTLSNTVWDFGDGSPIENHLPGSTFGHLFPGPGTYIVTMYNVSDAGCNSTVTSQSVTVDPDHTIGLNPGSDDNQTVCINTAIAPIIYTLGGGATGATVTGLPGGVTYNVVGTTLTILGSPNTTAGGPTFTYIVLTTGNSCIIADTTGTITVEPDHTITIDPGSNPNQAVCVNSDIIPITYTLGGGANNVTITGLPAGITYSVTGTTLTIIGTPVATVPYLFPYTITTTGNTCIRANAAGSIRVNPYPVPNFAIDKPSYCIPNAIVGFINGSTMPDGSSMTYSWYFDDPPSGFNNTSTLVNPSHWYTSAGPFNVRLTVTSIPPAGPGCVNSIIIPVNNIHPQPKADFSFSRPSVCIGANVTITDNSDGKDGSINQWNWDLGDGSTRTTNPVTYTYSDTITYNVTLYTINSFGCNSDTLTKPFTVYPYPHVNAGPDRFILEGGTITLEPVTFANDPQYEWTPNIYLIDNKVARVKVDKPLTDMTYRLTVTGRGGCQLSDDVFVKLLKFPLIPNTFTPNNDGINDTWRIDYLNTYPNNRVQVFTRSGQLVFESRGYDKPWDGTIKGKPLPFDTYYYIIEPGNKRDPITGYVTIIK